MSEFRPVDGAEIYTQPKPPDEMVWAICPWVQRHYGQCEKCPEYQPINGEMVQRGCYAMAEEACRVVFAMQARKF